jgi:hypothetical protein
VDSASTGFKLIPEPFYFALPRCMSLQTLDLQLLHHIRKSTIEGGSILPNVLFFSILVTRLQVDHQTRYIGISEVYGPVLPGMGHYSLSKLLL